jgi:DNA-binding FadR family transcriptional regulator
MRLVVELGLAHILFRRKTPEFIEKLESIARTEDGTTDRIDLLKLDVDFHSALYQISGNETIIRFQRMLMPIFDFVDSVILQKPRINQPLNIATHWDLIEELKGGTPTGFMHKMESHLWYFFEKI